MSKVSLMNVHSESESLQVCNIASLALSSLGSAYSLICQACGNRVDEVSRVQAELKAILEHMQASVQVNVDDVPH